MAKSRRRVAVWLRVSTDDQKLDAQQDAVDRYVYARGWDVVARFHEESVSGAAQYRKAVGEILQGARRRQYDAVVIFRGDRSFRSAGKGCLFIDELISTGCAFVSIEDGIDTSTPAGELMAKMAILMAEWERKAISARVRAGIDAARRRGKHLGRPRQDVDVVRAQRLMSKGLSQRAVARELGVARRTLVRALERVAQKPSSGRASQVHGKKRSRSC